MAEERSGAIEERGQDVATAQWRRTLWALVGIQFINTMAFSVLSPIMPLFLPVLGVETASAVYLWSGILNGVTSFIAAFASPLWGRLADRRGRKLMLMRSTLAIGTFTALMGVGGEHLAILRLSRADGGLCRFLQRGDRAGGEPGPRRAARLCSRLAQHRPTRRLAGGSADRRGAGRSDRQLPHPVLLHLGNHIDVDRPRLDRGARAVRGAARRPAAGDRSSAA